MVLKSATWGLIIGFGIQSMLRTNMDIKNIGFGIAALIALLVFRMSPSMIIIIAGFLGLIT